MKWVAGMRTQNASTIAAGALQMYPVCVCVCLSFYGDILSFHIVFEAQIFAHRHLVGARSVPGTEMATTKYKDKMEWKKRRQRTFKKVIRNFNDGDSDISPNCNTIFRYLACRCDTLQLHLDDPLFHVSRSTGADDQKGKQTELND